MAIYTRPSTEQEARYRLGIFPHFNNGDPRQIGTYEQKLISREMEKLRSARNQMASPFRLSEEMLAGTSPQGMSRTSAPKGPNMFDGGPASKVSLNTQPYNNQRLADQNMVQNVGAARPQAQADAIMGVRKQQLLSDNAQQKAVSFAEDRKATMLEVMGAPAIREMAMKTPVEMEKIRKDVAVSKAAGMGINPDLVA